MPRIQGYIFLCDWHKCRSQSEAPAPSQRRCISARLPLEWLLHRLTRRAPRVYESLRRDYAAPTQRGGATIRMQNKKRTRPNPNNVRHLFDKFRLIWYNKCATNIYHRRNHNHDTTESRTVQATAAPQPMRAAAAADDALDKVAPRDNLGGCTAYARRCQRAHTGRTRLQDEQL